MTEGDFEPCPMEDRYTCGFCCTDLSSPLQLLPCKHYLCDLCGSHQLRQCPICAAPVAEVRPDQPFAEEVRAALRRAEGNRVCRQCGAMVPIASLRAHNCPTKKLAAELMDRYATLAEEFNISTAVLRAMINRIIADAEQDLGSHEEIDNEVLNRMLRVRDQSAAAVEPLATLSPTVPPPSTRAAAPAATPIAETPATQTVGAVTTGGPPMASVGAEGKLPKVQLFWDFDQQATWKDREVMVLYQQLLKALRRDGVIESGADVDSHAYGVYWSYNNPSLVKVLQDMGIDMHLVSAAKKEETDRQLERSVRKSALRGAGAVVILSDDRDFNPLVRDLRQRDLKVYYVHDARPGSQHELLTSMFATGTYRITDLMAGIERPKQDRPMGGPAAAAASMSSGQPVYGRLCEVRVDRNGQRYTHITPDAGGGDIYLNEDKYSGGPLVAGQRVEYRALPNPNIGGAPCAVYAKPAPAGGQPPQPLAQTQPLALLRRESAPKALEPVQAPDPSSAKGTAPTSQRTSTSVLDLFSRATVQTIAFTPNPKRIHPRLRLVGNSLALPPQSGPLGNFNCLSTVGLCTHNACYSFSVAVVKPGANGGVAVGVTDETLSTTASDYVGKTAVGCALSLSGMLYCVGGTRPVAAARRTVPCVVGVILDFRSDDTLDVKFTIDSTLVDPKVLQIPRLRNDGRLWFPFVGLTDEGAEVQL